MLEKWNTSSLLQERLSEFGCTVLDYIGDKIIVDYFYSEAMYEKYLSGFDCKQGSGMYDRNQVLVFTRLPDDVMVVVQENGTITEMYKYFTILKATMRYRNTGVDSTSRILTFRIRKNKFGGALNLVWGDDRFSDFASIADVKRHLENTYGAYVLTDWSVYVEKDASYRFGDAKLCSGVRDI